MLKKKIKISDWDTSELLKTEDDIAQYLSVAFEEGEADAIAVALGNVAKARGMTEIAKKAGVSRENLYRSFRIGGDPKLTTLVSVMSSLGVKISVTPLHQ